MAIRGPRIATCLICDQGIHALAGGEIAKTEDDYVMFLDGHAHLSCERFFRVQADLMRNQGKSLDG